MGVENNECVIATTWSHNDYEQILYWINKQEYSRLFVSAVSIYNEKYTIILTPGRCFHSLYCCIWLGSSGI